MIEPQENLSASRYDFAGDYIAQFSIGRPGAVVFDIGAGEAPMRPVVERHELDWHGFDLFPSSADVTRWDLTREPAPVGDKKADLVLLLDVIEHLFDAGRAMANIVDAMKPGGVLILTAPNPHWSRARTHHLLTGNPACFTQHDLDVNHHVFVPLRHVIEKLVKDHGLSIERYVTLDGNEAARPKSMLSPTAVAEWLFRKLLEARDKSARGMSFALVLRRDGALQPTAVAA
jgi:SAM-dependent methyltransferase